jgi:hypothetical protein
MAQIFDEFHDAELVAIEIDRHAKSLMLRFASGSSATKTIGLSGVSHFRAVDLITQNVVSRIIVSSLDKLSSEDSRRWIGWVTSLSDNASFATDQQILDIEQRISQGELTLLVIEPSWGAEIVIIAKSYSVN